MGIGDWQIACPRAPQPPTPNPQPPRRGTSALVLSLLLIASATSGCASISLERPLVPVVPAEAPAPPLAEVWQTDVDAAFGPAAPVVAAQRIAVGVRNGRAVVLDAATGRRVGSLDVGQSIEAGLVLSPDGAVLYVPVSRGRFAVVAHAVTTGERQWGWRPASPAEMVDAGLALAAGVVVAPLHDGTTIGLDAMTGAERWRLAGADRAQNHAAPAVLPGGRVAVADDRGGVRVLDAATGAVVWTASAGAPVYAAPTVAGDRLLVSTTRGTLSAFDAATGAFQWTTRFDPSGLARVSSAAILSDRAAVGLTDGRVVALSLATGEAAWTWTGTGAVVGQPLAAGPTLYVSTMDERLVALDAATGQETFSATLRGRAKSAMTVADGRLIVLSEPRHITAFEATRIPDVAARP